MDLGRDQHLGAVGQQPGLLGHGGPGRQPVVRPVVGAPTRCRPGRAGPAPRPAGGPRSRPVRRACRAATREITVTRPSGSGQHHAVGQRVDDAPARRGSGHGVSLSRAGNDGRAGGEPGGRRGINSTDMRRTPAILCLLTLLAVLTVLASAAGAARTGARRRPRAIAHYRHLDAQVFGAVAVGMPNPRTVQIQHYSTPPPARGTRRPVLYRTRGRVTCGEIEGRASPGGVALLARVRHAVLRGPGSGAQRRARLPRRAHLEREAAARGGLPGPGDLARRRSTPPG